MSIYTPQLVGTRRETEQEGRIEEAFTVVLSAAPVPLSGLGATTAVPTSGRLALAYPDSVFTIARGHIPTRPGWSVGTYGLRVVTWAPSSGNVLWGARLQPLQAGGDASAIVGSLVTQVLPAGGAAVHVWENLAVASPDDLVLALDLSRSGNNVSDTLGASVYVLSVEVTYLPQAVR